MPALTRDDAAAEDLVHEALVRAYERRRTFRAGADLRSWLLSIVHNSFISGRRREASEQRRIVGAATIAPDDIEAIQETTARLTAVAQALAALPDDQRRPTSRGR